MGKVSHDIPVLQIAGYKNSGKTTFIKELVKQLSNEGYRVGVIKHHGHGGSLDFNEPGNTDTAQFQNEGAYMTAVEGEGVLHLKVNGTVSIPLEKIVMMYKVIQLDFILIEGFKKAQYPKFLIARDDQDLLSLLKQSENVVGVITDHLEERSGLLIFKPSQAAEFTEYIKEKLLKRR
ncbi:molybdopterin-guanine dinucleotide biosynthesis protein B [Pseudalkalibacillus sp. A8]|uniref:molybdopterin-guanine dinucleotide biosynthesis protein B n=1 Tax=Pseudalkalibacillus sp. A8 TaxID=3382641 RepID=UPI0038B4D024